MGHGTTKVNYSASEPVFTAGVNWYINDNVRFMFNYSYAVPTGEAVRKTSVSEFGFRTGVFW